MAILKRAFVFEILKQKAPEEGCACGCKSLQNGNGVC